MKKVLCVSFLLIVLMCRTCMGAVVYPEYTTANKGTAEINERINIVFDNSGHDYVKMMFMDLMTVASFAENSDIWLYPVAGSVAPVKLVADKDFMEKNFVAYSKSSNEFKSENVLEKAIADLNADTSVTNKRLFMFCNYDIGQIRSEYELYKIAPYAVANPDITFTSFTASSCIESRYIYDENFNSPTNYDSIYDKSLKEYLMIKYGYSECSSTYNKEEGYVKIDKGQADNNIFVTAYTLNSRLESNGKRNGVESCLYLGGCMMDAEGFEKYKKKDKVSGVALSYNHISTDASYNDQSFVAALFSTDGDCLNAAEEDLYIPVVNASEVKVYYRSTKGAGTCSSKTAYNTKQDKNIVNFDAPKTKTTGTSKTSSPKDLFDTTGSDTQKESKGILGKIFGGILAVVLFIVGIILRLLYLAILASIIGLAVSQKFRSFVHLKLIGSRVEPVYEFISINIKKIINEIKGSGVKIKGTADLDNDYIFISKASADMVMSNNRISLVVKELEARGINCWLSETGIKPGEDYNDIIPKAIKNCTMMVFFVSTNSIHSSEVESEIGTAKEYKKIILPVQIVKFDLFKQFPKWAHMLKQYQRAELYKSAPELIKECADSIEAMYNKLKK